MDDDELLRHLRSRPQERATFKQLVRELRIKAGQRQALRSQLHRLTHGHQLQRTGDFFAVTQRSTADTKIASNQSHKASARPTLSHPSSPAGSSPRLRPGELEGRISVHRDGFGFVLPSLPLKAVEGDIFIPPPFLNTAMHGDTVAVQLLRPPSEGRAEGKVTRVLQRAHASVVGLFQAASPVAFVRPYENRLRERIIIPRGAERPEIATAPHRVLGTEAQHHKVPKAWDTKSLDGMVVDVEITSYPTLTTEARGRVVEVLGHPDDFGVDVEIIIRKHHLPHRFPDPVLADAAAVPPALSLDDLAGRRDFRSLPIVTIDGETARDFDDAVHVERERNGHFRLQVHIADVSHYVRPGTALDQEARLRGTSVYFPDRAIPMLPQELSSDLCSLRPQQDRLVVSCLMDISTEGDVVGYELVPGVIRSTERMTYTAVHAVLEGEAASRMRYARLVDGFERMRDLATILNRRRVQRGSIDFDLPEPTIAFDEAGLMQSIAKSARNQAHRLIEEFMLAANETVARHLEAAGHPSVYRIHEIPDPRKIAEFEELAASFGYSLGVGPLPVRRIRTRSQGRIRTIELPIEGKVTISPRNYQELTRRIAGRPEERILNYLMLRSLKQARYSGENRGHFALATASYTHFTSPIRRYPDLLIHRLLKHEWSADFKAGALLSGSEIATVTRENSEAERRADDAERELTDWKKVRFMETRLGEEFDALILHVTRNGFYVELLDQFIEGLVPVGALEDDRYLFQEGSHALVGQKTHRRFRIGDRLKVIVERIDPVRHQVHFAPAPTPVTKTRRRRPLI